MLLDDPCNDFFHSFKAEECGVITNIIGNSGLTHSQDNILTTAWMNILLSGTTGYIGKRLLPVLLAQGHDIVCCVRDKARFDTSPYNAEQLKIIEVDFLKKESLHAIPDNIDAAYYLIHSMSSSVHHFEDLEREAAGHFKDRVEQTSAKQVIYLGGIANEQQLSQHLSSRMAVEAILASGNYHFTSLRAGIILGSGSASFEIIRDLVEKLPVMVAPRWLNTKSQPIAISNVIQFLKGVLGFEYAYDRYFDIGGPEVLTYKQMLLKFARIRGLKRTIIVVPVMTPKLSSYWLYFITSISYRLAVNLVNSMKIEIVGKQNDLAEKLGINLLTYDDAIKIAFDKIEQENVLSSWTDAMSGKSLEPGLSRLIQVPTYGCYVDKRSCQIDDMERTLNRLWSVGGKQGWYYANWLWMIRGFMDKVFGGVGLRRGRRSDTSIQPGDALDFWRVIYASRDEKRLLLYAEMKLPGEAWLEFNIRDGTLYQRATFRPLGLWGRIYWFLLRPLHGLIFSGMIHRIAN